MPDRAPAAGEQYRFHVDMGACIGCKCCVVACNEQNGNPASINWRRVGEIEGGWFPAASKSYLSMGCNHCLEPTCLEGCPVDAYTKDPITGIVRHSADACIGCQYCTWNCSYGVPQYNPERGVVGKCDMCHGRLSLGQAPACVSACPEGALAIEIVNVAEWRASVESTAAEIGLPGGDGSLSTTRITLPDNLPPNARPARHHARHARTRPLVAHRHDRAHAALGRRVRGHLAAATPRHADAPRSRGPGVARRWRPRARGATFHLGRPAHAYRALRMWRRSWLSREVLAFAAFSHVAAVYAGLLWLQLPGSVWVGGLTVALGLAGVTASACIYRVPARPAWNTPYTLLQFNLTAAILGPLFAAAAVAGATRWLAIGAASMAVAQATVFALRFFRAVASDSLELKGTARLLSTVLANRLVLRGLLLAIGAIALPLLATGLADGQGRLLMLVALLVALGAEIVERYLFFVSVVPKHLAAPYIASAREAA